MKKIFGKISDWVGQLTKKIYKIVDKSIPVAVDVVQWVKKAIDSGEFQTVANIAKSVIPGTYDDVFIDKAVKIAEKEIPKLAIKLEIVEKVSDIEETDPTKLKESLIALKSVFGDKWEQFCTGLASEIIVKLSNKTRTHIEAWKLAKEYYDKYVKVK